MVVHHTTVVCPRSQACRRLIDEAPHVLSLVVKGHIERSSTIVLLSRLAIIKSRFPTYTQHLDMLYELIAVVRTGNPNYVKE